jgi:hypothetical protein
MRTLLIALGLLSGCTASTTTLVAEVSTTSHGTDTTTQGRTVTPGATSCGTAGALCLGGGQACAAAGGTPLPPFDKDCAFDDGPGTCCLPPATKPSGDTCADHGGLCAPVGGCLREGVDSLFAPPKCGAPPMVCCVPPASCPGPRPVCCDATATFRASCDRGTWRCPSEGMRMETDGNCD